MTLRTMKTPGAAVAAALFALLPISTALAAPPAMSGASAPSPAPAAMMSSKSSKHEDTAQVKAIQEALNKDGADLKVDGIYGPLTERALLNYQSANHLPITGKIDEATEHSLHVG